MLEIIGGIAVVVVLGLGVEYVRRQKLRTWVEQESGVFTPSGAVPEGAAFDSPEHVSYRNIARFERRGLRYVVAERLYTRRDIKETSTSSQVLCLVVLPGRELPPVVLAPPLPTATGAMVEGMRRIVGGGRPPTIELTDSLPAFVQAFEVRAIDAADVPSADHVSAVLVRAVQQAVLDHGAGLANVALRGEVLRVQTVTQQLKRNHAQALAAAEAIVAALPR